MRLSGMRAVTMAHLPHFKRGGADVRLTPMRYKNYTWPHNPQSYTIRYERRVAVHKLPYGRSSMEDLGLKIRVMEGEGEFCGEGAYREFSRLASVFYDDGPGVLVHPVWVTTRAYFVSLELVQEPMPDYVRYRFSFWEDDGQGKTVLTSVPTAEQASGRSKHTVRQGETLWGIAQTAGVTLAALLQANPQIRNPNAIRVGERVKLP